MNKIRNLPASAWITLALLAASVEPIVAKFAFRLNAEPLQLIALKNILGAFFVLPLLLKWLRKGQGSGAGQMAFAGLLLFATNSLTLLSLQRLSVVLLITIVTCVPALVAILNSMIGRDRLGPKFWLGFLMCFGGIVLTLDFKDISLNLDGVIYALAAAVSSSIYRVRMEIICERENPASAAAISYFSQGLASLAILPWALPFAASTVFFGCWIGISAALANIAFVYALNMVGATRISVLTMTQRQLLIIAAAVLLHETVTNIQILGIALVMTGIQLAQVQRQLSKCSPAEMPASKKATDESVAN
ncbi:MAG: EamA family transporter [Candidatus Obscuribacterales bacterium]|nr:EamA family transporter [Candidatus Obscuribacterales bacterium]